MDDPLQRLIRELQSEKCPAEVLDRVSRRVSGNRGGGRRWRPSLAWSLAGAVVVLGLGSVAFWQRTPRPGPSLTAAEQAAADRALVVRQTVGALALVGHTLRDAATRAETSLLEDAATPLLKSFQTAKTKITENL